LHAFYTDDGVISRAALAELRLPLLRSAPSLSIHALGGGAAWQAALFALAAACAVGLALGWRTRTMTIATWALMTSLHARMPLVLYRADAVLRVMLFVAIWLPLGARFSVDARRLRPAQVAEVCGAACFVAAAQLAIVYLAGVAHKSGETWRDGSAVYYALQLDDYTTVFGRWIGAHAMWSPTLTYGTVAFELIAPLLLFVPWRRDALRLVAVVLAFTLHLGMLVAMRLDLFPWIMFACWTLFLPPPFWEACARTVPLLSALPRAYGRAHDRRWAPALGAMLVAIVTWNVGEVSGEPPPALGAVLRPLGLAQRWSMFSPDPARDDGWIVAAARLTGGAETDLLSGDTPSNERPRLTRDLRWRGYLALVARDAGGPLASGLIYWLCTRDANIEHLALVFEAERSMPPGEPPARESIFLGSSTCNRRTTPPQPRN